MAKWYYHEGFDQANTRNEFHRAGTLKAVKKRRKYFPWTTYTAHYVWKQVNPGGYGLTWHYHQGNKKVYHSVVDWVWIGNS